MFGDVIETKQSLERLDSDKCRQEKDLELKNVFDPAQLAERLLKDEDNINRGSDVPDRIQRTRKPPETLDLSLEEMESRLNEEAIRITEH
jgi:transcription elongation factor SPT6